MNLKLIKRITTFLSILFIFGCSATQKQAIHDKALLQTLEKRIDDLSKSLILIIKDTNVMHNEIEMLAESHDSLARKTGKLEEGVTYLSKKLFDSSATNSSSSERNHTPETLPGAGSACSSHAGHAHTFTPDTHIHDDTIHAVIRNIAAGFWDALLEHDLDAAKTFATRASSANLKLNDSIDDSNNQATFGDIIINEDKAITETILNTRKDGSQISIPLQTILITEDNQWKVDADQTMMSVFGGAMGELMKDVGEAMKNGMGDMGKALTEGMPTSMEGIPNPPENTAHDTTSD
ncbi:MAG: hypothetical protein E3K37_04060 [Candidatus Kuenenia sp.]|nr:hypothetical protein [Candidatus Kuenenia hertensis]